jgi:hypothetical protein
MFRGTRPFLMFVLYIQDAISAIRSSVYCWLAKEVSIPAQWYRNHDTKTESCRPIKLFQGFRVATQESLAIRRTVSHLAGTIRSASLSLVPIPEPTRSSRLNTQHALVICFEGFVGYRALADRLWCGFKMLYCFYPAGEF